MKKIGSNKSHELFGSINKHEVSRGEGSIKNMRCLGPTKDMRFQEENKKIVITVQRAATGGAGGSPC